METFKGLKSIGLKNVKIGNIDVFTKTEEERRNLIKVVGTESI
ncbi:MAG: hypothetical protein ACFE8E_00960 [Candidatus Hodarchaeota archaeon]